jgi:hypothetical protein
LNESGHRPRRPRYRSLFVGGIVVESLHLLALGPIDQVSVGWSWSLGGTVAADIAGAFGALNRFMVSIKKRFVRFICLRMCDAACYSQNGKRSEYGLHDHSSL